MHILRSRFFPLKFDVCVQVSLHLDWMYPALTDLIPSRSLEVRSGVRDLFHDKLGPFIPRIDRKP